ncbi:hypothetical protein [Burkholderia contaminans]|uniref:LysR family transcriptional regulator n=1 Tax=Burkholderia contaminans TaxID=488447 RepID=A0A6P2WD41_9BURK|nr:hypothetical protein [Burkholderia contaminans]VWC95409.1 LysR family transcriptional regulator [Burkholderia contaminans]
MQRTLRLPIPVSHFENGGRMIDANVSVLPEGTARRRSRGRANEQTAQAERPPQICVTDRDTLPRFTRNPVDPLVNIAPRSAESTTFPSVRTAIGRFRPDSALSTGQIGRPSFV